MKYVLRLFTLVLIFPVFSMQGQDDPLLDILREEMNNAKEEFSKQELPPYYFELSVTEVFQAGISLNSGALVLCDTSRYIGIKADMRVGDHDFDNTHTLADDMWGGYMSMPRFASLPKDGNELETRYRIYKLLNDLYSSSLESYKEKKEKLKLSTREEKPSKDLTREVPEQYFEAPLPSSAYAIDLDAWKERLKRYSAVLQPYLKNFASAAAFNFEIRRSYFLNSEGSEVVQNNQHALVAISGITSTEEDQAIFVQYVEHAFTPENLPSEEKVISELQEYTSIITAMKSSPKAEPYVGPAILSPEAAGVFFHEIFGHRIEGHRLAYKYDSKTFREKVGDPILPKFLSVTFDPGQSSYNGIDLIGHYKYDNQGIRGQRVECIKEGILNSYLMSRKPVEGFEHSNGHGRSDLASTPVSRQSNMFVEATKTHSMDELRKKLIRECKKQDLEYGYYFKKVSGGFTNTMNYMPDFFSIIPLEVYRIYVDGRPDELVHGVNLIGTPLVMFSEIIAAGDETGVFNGICGAESGGVPVAALSPALLVKKIETQNQFAIDIDEPILQTPTEK